jgi:hypothetical protein
MNKKEKKLDVKAETIRSLVADELESAQGGAAKLHAPCDHAGSIKILPSDGGRPDVDMFGGGDAQWSAYAHY